MAPTVIIKSIAPNQYIKRTPENQIEPAFRVDANRSLTISAKHWEKRALHHLILKVIRNPQDLHLHIQRIHMHRSLNDRDGLYGALIDLYIALGQGGYALRVRMVKKCEQHLSAEQYATLSSYNSSGLDVEDTEASMSQSFLCKGLIGTPIVKKLPS